MEMTVTGFDEVCAAARKAISSRDFPVPVITVPGFVLLKIIAYLDRKDRGRDKHKDDATDIEYWLRNYAGGTRDERRFDLVAETMAKTFFTLTASTMCSRKTTPRDRP